ncbi:hypothetical protein [Phocaeicola vulgatus]|uniref:hypothetical protein n=1 Tax=Phocaeicola vulgatus TaxID=821 RepID=UPI0032E386E9
MHVIKKLPIPLAATCATCFHLVPTWCRYAKMLVYLQTKWLTNLYYGYSDSRQTDVRIIRLTHRQTCK